MIRLFKYKVRISFIWLMTIGLILPIGIIPLKLLVTIYQVSEPQAIFVLGGDIHRTPYAVRLAQQNPNLNIWVSDFPYAFRANEVLFQQASIAAERIHYDFCATDTVTNFTCTVEKFRNRGIHYLYLVTSDYHMKRAMAIANLVFGSRGIAVMPVVVPSNNIQSESLGRVVRDSLRSLLWLVTGRTGARFNPQLNDLN